MPPPFSPILRPWNEALPTATCGSFGDEATVGARSGANLSDDSAPEDGSELGMTFAVAPIVESVETGNVDDEAAGV